MASIRVQRYQKEIMKHFNQILQSKIRDPRLSWVTISDVRISPDLMYAKIFFRSMEDVENVDELVKIITKSSGVFKRELGKLKILRVIPELTFIYDETEDIAERIETILDEIKHEND